MSRTYKDKPYKYRKGDFCAFEYAVFNNTEALDAPKKPKRKNTVYWWMSTPSWWTNLVMNRPMRHMGRIWETNIKKVNNMDELEEEMPPDVFKKPHVYYW